MALEQSGVDVAFGEVAERIEKGRRFLVTTHVNPEGDAVGSLLGLTLALRWLGKDVTAYMEDPVPYIYRFLPGADTVVDALFEDDTFDGCFVVDCGQKKRLGGRFNVLKSPGTIINIDHHKTNDNFGDINIIVPEASAAGEIIYDLLRFLRVDITPDIATNLYVAIHTDTGSFRYSSSTSDAFIKAGELVRLGADPWEITIRIYESYPENKLRLLGMALSTLEVVEVDSRKIATMVVTLDMMRRVDGGRELTDGFVNFARAIEGVETGILFREESPGEFKISLRSKGRIDVSRVARFFGGGGHRNASGFNIKGGLEEVKMRVIDAVKEMSLGSDA